MASEDGEPLTVAFVMPPLLRRRLSWKEEREESLSAAEQSEC